MYKLLLLAVLVSVNCVAQSQSQLTWQTGIALGNANFSYDYIENNKVYSDSQNRFAGKVFAAYQVIPYVFVRADLASLGRYGHFWYQDVRHMHLISLSASLELQYPLADTGLSLQASAGGGMLQFSDFAYFDGDDYYDNTSRGLKVLGLGVSYQTPAMNGVSVGLSFERRFLDTNFNFGKQRVDLHKIDNIWISGRYNF
ncbi:hypothetical protein [Paraferrimonas sp. SM1919]|uniref:hypothetical protein n=1 Tax=Paraferrimonas sp. SM1919 TaxID=2662263 RepID=UPI0013D63BDE|nr:hypothetical protein [Paraferrimonas sp. SM1919]